MTGRLPLRTLTVEQGPESGYPFSVPAVRGLTEIHFTQPVTFFAGENGSGKSTLLEALGLAAGSVPVRTQDAGTEMTLMAVRPLAARMQLGWNEKTRRGFFLRAEDFFEYKKSLGQAVVEYQSLSAEMGRKFTGYAADLARGPLESQRAALVERYGEDLNTRSHGESFLDFFRARFTGRGLYLLDEPDTALSVQSVFGLIALLSEMVRDGAQFIIATHSPVLLAFPGASILSFDRSPPALIPYGEVEGVNLLRSFLERPDAYLRHL